MSLDDIGWLDENVDFLTRRKLQQEIIKCREAERLQTVIDTAAAVSEAISGVMSKKGSDGFRRWIKNIERRIKQLRGDNRKKEIRTKFPPLQGKFLR